MVAQRPEIPPHVQAAAERWSLTDIDPFHPENSRGGTDFMARAQSALYGDVVLKYASHNPRIEAEVATLRHFSGHGAVEVFEAAPDEGLYMMQALSTGQQLATLCMEGRDDEAREYVERYETLTGAAFPD